MSLFNGILICLFVYDSPRIYIDKGEIEKMNKILECVASFNWLKKEFLEKSKSEEYKQLIKEIIESANYETENENEIELKDLTKENVDNKHDKLICLKKYTKRKKFQNQYLYH